MCFVGHGIIYSDLQDLRNWDSTGLTSSKIELFILEKRTVIQSHHTLFVMHLWNGRNQPRPMSVKNSHHMTEKAGLKSTSGQIGTPSTNRINVIPKHCKKTCDLL